MYDSIAAITITTSTKKKNSKTALFHSGDIFASDKNANINIKPIANKIHQRTNIRLLFLKLGS